MRELSQRVTVAIEASKADVGVVIRHVESAQEVAHRADVPVPLASVVKVPVLVEAFHQIRTGTLALDEQLELDADVKALGSGVLTLLDDGLSLTVRDLLTLMTVISDNTATDLLMRRLGIDAIAGRMRRLGLAGIHVVHTIGEIFADMLPSADPDQDRAALAAWEAANGVRRDGFAYSLGPDNNVGTPRDMARLLEMIVTGVALDRQGCDAMLDILHAQQLRDRLPRFLPPGVRMAHKTGTFSGIRNDCGVISGEEGRGHVVIAMLTSWDHSAVRNDPRADRRRAQQIDDCFGEIGLAAYETFFA
ncbi:serine hydrolase [Actinopolymorpha sp. B9G3]|uniref:serine hydrolase n=1 Tax=Actinopolymorpha sp. B9G3 TaxID=3158970 RepID=UPI0032D9ACF9